MYQARNVGGHVYLDVPSQECGWSCLFRYTKPGMWVVMLIYMYQARNVGGHVYLDVPSQ